MAQVNLTFPDSTYTSLNKPYVEVLKTDLSDIQTAINDTDSTGIKNDGSVALTGNLNVGGNKLVNAGAPTSATDLATIGSVYPIGSVYIAVVATDPSTILGFGTWVRIAEGCTLIGQDSTDSDFNAAEETGGQKTVNLSHTHNFTTSSKSLSTSSAGSHTHSFAHTHIVQRHASQSPGAGLDSGENFHGQTSSQSTSTTGAGGSHTHSISSHNHTGATNSSQGTTDIMNPYLVVYMWKRTV